MITALWILSALLIAVGVAGTVLPALPGVILVLAGIVLGAWIDDFTRVSGVTVAIVAVLAIAAWVIDYVSGVMGAQKAGASKEAIVGALIGKYVVDRDLIRARNVGLATWIGMAIGMVAKIALAFLMIGIFVAALLIP